MTEIAFRVEGNPIPKQRARVVTTKSGKTTAYTPAPTTGWQQRVGWAAVLAMGSRPPFTGPVGIEARFYRANERRCDFDNLTKAVCDALQGGIVFNDDDQVTEAHIYKTVDRADPRTEIRVWPAGRPPQ